MLKFCELYLVVAFLKSMPSPCWAAIVRRMAEFQHGLGQRRAFLFLSLKHKNHIADQRSKQTDQTGWWYVVVWYVWIGMV